VRGKPEARSQKPGARSQKGGRFRTSVTLFFQGIALTVTDVLNLPREFDNGGLHSHPFSF
jgi:hypothetical protein